MIVDPEQVGAAVGRLLATLHPGSIMNDPAPSTGTIESMFPDLAPDLSPPQTDRVHVSAYDRRFPTRDTIGGALDRNVTSVGRRSPRTSHAAAERIYPRTGSMRRAVIEWLAGREIAGATDDEIEAHFGWTHQSASACRNRLMNDGWVEDSGEKRKVRRSGNLAIVWTLTDAARAAMNVA